MWDDTLQFLPSPFFLNSEHGITNIRIRITIFKSSYKTPYKWVDIYSKYNILSKHITDTKQHKTYHILNKIYYQDGELALPLKSKQLS